MSNGKKLRQKVASIAIKTRPNAPTRSEILAKANVGAEPAYVIPANAAYCTGIGKKKLNVWPRDEQGNLIGD